MALRTRTIDKALMSPLYALQGEFALGYGLSLGTGCLGVVRVHLLI